MRHSEHMLVAETKERALQLIRSHFSNYRKKYGIKEWKWRVPPEAKKYDGKSKALTGKWRAYARISFTKRTSA